MARRSSGRCKHSDVMMDSRGETRFSCATLEFVGSVLFSHTKGACVYVLYLDLVYNDLQQTIPQSLMDIYDEK